MISCQLRISFENLLDGLPCRELFENQIDWNSCSLEACFAHHHIRANLDVLRQFHIPNCISDSTTPQGSARPHAAPGAILTHQRMHFSGAQREVRVAEGGDAAVMLVNVFGAEQIQPNRISNSGL